MQLIYSAWAQESVKNIYQQYDPALLAGLAGQEGTGETGLKSNACSSAATRRGIPLR